MRIINFGYYTEYSFWGIIEYPNNKEAFKERNKLAKEFRKQGKEVTCYTLAGQMCKYASLGEPDGRIGNVYKLSVKNKI